MEKYKYSITVTDHPGNPFPLEHNEQTTEKQAIEQAKKYAEQYPDKLVFVEFFRQSDGQTGYINPDGAGFTGKSWTEGK